MIQGSHARSPLAYNKFYTCTKRRVLEISRSLLVSAFWGFGGWERDATSATSIRICTIRLTIRRAYTYTCESACARFHLSSLSP